MPKSQKKKKSVKKKSAPKRKKSVKKKKAVIKSALKTADEITPVIEEIEYFADVSEERASIISIVKGLEGQVETAFKLKEVLEAELDKTRQKLAKVLETRSHLKAQVETLQGPAALAEQLREDMSFAEQERNKFADLLSQAQAQLEETTAERDSLVEQLSSTEANMKELEGEKITFEAQVMNLKDNITDVNRLRKELAETTQANQQSREQTHDLARRLETAEKSKDAIERELDGSHQNSQNLQKDLGDLRAKFSTCDSHLADLRIMLEDQQVANKELMKNNTSLKNELKMLNIDYEAAKNDLDAFKDALHDIRNEATQTSGRVRQKYFKPKKSR
jgi:chromosome segregation ATPase